MLQVRGGELLDRVINKEHYTELEAARCFTQIMSAIQYLHRQLPPPPPPLPPPPFHFQYFS